MLPFLFLSGAQAYAQPQEPASAPAIRVRVDRVNLGVIVTDARGRFVEGLHREDFHVFDNGLEQPLTEFLKTEDPAQLLMLVETGPAVYLLEGSHLQAAYTLLNGLSAGDRVAMVRYADAPQSLLDFTEDKRTAAATLNQLRFNLGFGQLNLASSVTTALDWLSRVPGKKSLVLLSTGVDTSPPGAGEALLARLRTTDVRIFAVSLSGELRDTGGSGKKSSAKKNVSPEKAADAAAGFEEADQHLRAIAEATGGRAYFPKNAKEFNAVYAEIALLIRHEYSLAFPLPARDAQLHSLEVRVGAPATPNTPAPVYRLDHRQAYLAPASDSN